MKRILLILISACLLLHSSCKKNEPAPVDQNPGAPTPYTPVYPTYFPPLIVPASNPLTEEGVDLGRHLYYDIKLGENGPNDGLSCASCHLQNLSFSSPGGSNAILAHINLGWNSNFLWNGKIQGGLEDIMFFEVKDFFQTDLDILRSDPNYPTMFKKVFGSEDITYERTAMALAQFFRSLTSYESEYDRVILQQGTNTYSDDEAEGYLIFFSEKGDCFHCHSNPFLTDNSFRNIGLDSVFSGFGMGRYNITQNPADMGKFKTPTLRNVALTSPYMHDNRFSTLEEVVEHYNSGVKHSTTLDPIMTKPGKELGLQLTAQQKKSLVAFLKTFTDTSFTKRDELSNPF